MIRPDRTLGIRLGTLQAASFVSIGVYLPFFPLWLQSKALPPAIIGIVVAIPIIVRILVSAPLLMLADRSFGARRLLLFSHMGQIAGFPLLLLVDGSLPIILIVALVAVAQAAVIPANDLVVTNAVQRQRGLNYGWIRGCGSIAFFLANIAAGYLVGGFGAGAIALALSLIPLLGISATLMAVPHEMPEPVREDRPLPAPSRLPKMLLLLLVAGALTQGTHGALNAFASIHWHAQGLSDATIGYLWAAGVVAEIIVFVLLGQAVGRGSGVWLILIGSAAAAIRFTIMSLNPGLGLTFVLQAMHSLSFGATHLGTMAALAAFSPPGARGRAQGVYGSLAALVMALSTVASGVIYREAGAQVFAAMAPLGAIGFVLTLLAVRLLRAQPQSAGTGG